jgi:hypothetical protein
MTSGIDDKQDKLPRFGRHLIGIVPFKRGTGSQLVVQNRLGGIGGKRPSASSAILGTPPTGALLFGLGNRVDLTVAEGLNQAVDGVS